MMTTTKRAAIGVVAMLVTIACQEPPIERVEVVRPVKMLTLGTSIGTGSYEYPGSVRAMQEAEVAFEVPGLIIELRVREGQVVRRGDMLARIDPRDYEAQRDAALAGRNVAWSDYQRFQELYAADAASLQELDFRRRQYEVQEAQLRIAQKALDDTNLRAPFAGRVARRIVENFTNVRAKEPVILLEDESTLEVRFNIPENDALWPPGMSVAEMNERVDLLVMLTSLPERRFPTRVKQFNTSADPVTRTFEITLLFDPPGDVTVRPGMTARVIAAPARLRAEQFSIPAAAVVGDEGGGAFVWRIDTSSMMVSRVPVEVGEMGGDEIVVLSGLSDGDTIAVSGARSLRDGMRVRLLEG